MSLGPFRLPGDSFRAMTRLYPEDLLFAAPFDEEGEQVAYRRDLEAEMVGFCTAELLRHIPREIFVPGLSALPAVDHHHEQSASGS